MPDPIQGVNRVDPLGPASAAASGSPPSPSAAAPPAAATVAVKSMQHFRAAFEPIAREVVLVDTSALCSEIYTPELFTKVRRPIWPLDPV